MTDTILSFLSPKKPTRNRLFARRFCLLALLAPAAFAQQPAGLTEQESLRLGLSRPDIHIVIEAAHSAARSEADAIGRWPNPILELQRESIPSASGRSTERSFVLSQQLDLSGKRALRKSAANARALATSLDGDQRRLDVAAEIRLRFFEALYRKELVAATRTWDERMAMVGSTVQKLHQGGEVAGYDRRRMALERASAQAQLRSQQAAYDRSREQLLALLGAAPAHSEPAGTLLPDEPGSIEVLLARLDSRPDLRAAQRRIDAFGLERQAAQRQP